MMTSHSRIGRVLVSCVLMLSVSAATAGAGELPRTLAQAAREAAAKESPAPTMPTKNKGLMMAGTGLFVAGMAVGLYGFINDKNGEFSEFGEADSSNKHLGAAGLSAAFAGGVLMFLGSRTGRHVPSVSVTPRAVTISKQVSW